jgi:NAD+--dinitrogen-reductase ADP-D-ribosyltransferase
MDSEPLRGAWQRGDSTTLVGVPSARLNSAAFNDAPVPLHIAGVREANRTLFVLLSLIEDPALASSAFETYMTTMFGIPPAAEGKRERRTAAGSDDAPERRHYRASYLRLLRGWAYDSNGPEGAVLKGWVESRFGLFPTFHKEPIRRFASPQWTRYVEEKMSSRFHSNTIWSQLDLLYEFAQWVLRRRAGEAQRHLVLFRGVNDFDEHQIIERLEKRTVIVRLNNLVSFTADRDIAGWFGDIIMEAAVPYEKIMFFNTLLPHHPLKGEGEVLVIGGDYKVRATYG